MLAVPVPDCDHRLAVRFHVPAALGAQVAEVAGDFSAWAPLAMLRDSTGAFHLVVQLDRGRRWRYRFFLDGDRWINDPAAGSFVDGPNGSSCSELAT
jgi:1,4-alpha-glucan branching enzyme